MITFKSRGNWDITTRFLERAKKGINIRSLDKYGRQGIAALRSATPVDTGLTSQSWYYQITQKKGLVEIVFLNSNVQNGIPIAIILQYGHGTRNGGYVQGRDYINPAIQPIFDKIVEDAWREVTRG